ncbi:MAG: elongation factor P [Erysipelotrichaceae bacterium]
MIIVNDLKPGQTIKYENDIFTIVETSHNKTAMRQMIVKAKVKNLRSGVINELTFTGGGKVEPAHIDKKEMQYLYDTDEDLVFMDNETYEQLEIPRSNLTWELNFMKANDNINISMYEGEILGIILPDKVSMKVVETEPAVKGDTATSASKLAKLESGLELRVPLFINVDENIIVSTSDAKYSGRDNK